MSAALFNETAAQPITDCGCYEAFAGSADQKPMPIAQRVCSYWPLDGDAKPCHCECHSELPSGADYAMQVIDFAASVRNYPGPALADPDATEVFSFLVHDQPTADTLLHHAAAVLFQADSVSRFIQLGQSQNNADRARVLTHLVEMLETRQFPPAEIERFKSHCIDQFWP